MQPPTLTVLLNVTPMGYTIDAYAHGVLVESLYCPEDEHHAAETIKERLAEWTLKPSQPRQKPAFVWRWWGNAE